MSWNAQDLINNLKTAIERHELTAIDKLCNQFVDYLGGSDTVYPQRDAERVVQILQSDRRFNLVRDVADALIKGEQLSFKIRRQYAQALIELGQLNNAIRTLKKLTEDTQGDARENPEAWGLLGRAYKQLYINADDASLEENKDNLRQAVQAYFRLYQQSSATAAWHGINTVALLCRAQADGVELTDYPEPRELAQAILDDMEAKSDEGQATAWDRATAAEACIALGRHDDATKWMLLYAQDSSVTAFPLASTLRQLVEVWRLPRDQEPGLSLIPILEAEQLKREGGCVDISPNDASKTLQAVEDSGGWEKVFGSDAFQSISWLDTALQRSRSVARIGRETSRGEGTGFLVRGSDICESLDDELLLFTNAHVISDNPSDHPAVAADDAVITFNGPKMPGENDVYSVKQIVWSSPRDELDATLLRLDRVVTGITPYPIAKNPPLADGKQCVTIIGHPHGGVLSFSFRDSKLLDVEPPRLHYRTPTVGGSSGSPVFSGPQWKLIGIHHWGSTETKRLHNQPGTYEANEGIWIGSIIKRIQQELLATV